MKKFLLKILFFLLIFYIPNAFAWTKVWDLNTDTDYTQQDTNLTDISWWLGQLKMQLNHTWSIINWNWWALLDQADSVVVDWNYAYITSVRSDALEIVNISTPSNPTHVSSLTDGTWWATLNWPRWIIKNWNYLYIAVNVSDTLEVVDVSDPTNPTHVTSIANSWTTYLNWAMWVSMSWSYLYVTANTSDALTIFDISTASSPTFVWSLTDATRLNWAYYIDIQWNYAYITSYTNDSLEIIDITDPTNPSFIWELTDGSWWANLNWPVWIKVINNYAYIASYISDALEIVDISNPSLPVHAGTLTDTTWWATLNWAAWIYIEWNFAYIWSYVSDALEVVNISSVSNPTHVTNILDWTWWSSLNSAFNPIKIWNYIYITVATSDALEIIEITYDKTSPYIIPNTSLVYSWSVDKLTTTFSNNNQWSVSYQISKDNWTTWYYLVWTTRTSTTVWVIESNTETDINAEIQSFNWLAWWTWEFLWKVFLTSNWNQKVEIDEISMAFTSAWLNEIIDFETPGWYTVTNWTWTRQTTTFYEWTYSIQADNWWANNSTSCFNVNRDIYNDSTVSFYSKVDSESWWDFLRFYIDWVKMNEWSWNVAWWSWTYDISNGNHDFDWCYEKDWSVNSWADTAWIDYIEIKELPAPPTEVAVLDFEVTWWYTVTTTVTAEDWFRQQNTVYEWLYSLQSANITDNQSVCFERLQTISSIDTWITFYRKVDSESWYDFLEFYINWTLDNKWAWNIDWAKETYTLAAWDYTFKWCYSKDGSVSNWADAAWVDIVALTQDPPIITEVTPVATPTNDNTPDYTFNTPIAWDISYSGSCTSSTNTWAVIWDNTITFDSLADWIYTDCTIQILASPQNSTILNVSNFTVDTTWINIIFNNPIDWWTIAPANFNIDLSYSDTNWVNTWSIILQLFEWNWSSYWPDIAWDFVDFTWATITDTWAIYPTLALTWATQYKIEFSIDDTTWNNSVWTSVFDVSSWDTTPPTITNNFPTNGSLYPNSNFDINIDYSDADSTINTWSIVMTIKKWDWTAWWADISWIYVTWNTISSTNAIYNTSKLWFGKYQLYFYIEDSLWNWSSTTTEFYIDEPELIVSTWSIDIWELKASIDKFSTGSLDITIKTVWAAFQLILNKQWALTTWTVDILDWNWTNWVWYDQDPYSTTINLINVDEVIATQVSSINVDWNKNSYIYSIKLWANISEEQAAWEYSMWIKFGLNLDY